MVFRKQRSITYFARKPSCMMIICSQGFGNRRSNYVCGVISIRGSYPDFPAQAKEGFRRTHERLGKTHQTHCGPVINHKYQSGWRNYSTLVPRPCRN
ncbi:uncharacterized protein LOC126870261 isoform X2 [Bombus huntii]|uniref:uncharacterized protein LOC126870261 isoform X2 n=1 Tax=Bombus huntii TaxID=85661 RepID=UPI0021AABB3C|nr:uncharacterized protein LOC126870261 isoform X2 [Bombus huntii]